MNELLLEFMTQLLKMSHKLWQSHNLLLRFVSRVVLSHWFKLSPSERRKRRTLPPHEHTQKTEIHIKLILRKLLQLNLWWKIYYSSLPVIKLRNWTYLVEGLVTFCIKGETIISMTIMRYVFEFTTKFNTKKFPCDGYDSVFMRCQNTGCIKMSGTVRNKYIIYKKYFFSRTR